MDQNNLGPAKNLVHRNRPGLARPDEERELEVEEDNLELVEN
ncbi:MAG: hypothetical protein ACREB3_13635 [Burkholderiales bacterium]